MIIRCLCFPSVFHVFWCGLLLLSSSCKHFRLSTCASKANGKSIVVVTSGQNLFAYVKMVLAPKVQYFVRLSTRPFWWWGPATQNGMLGSDFIISSRNSLSENLPLSSWCASTSTSNYLICHSNAASAFEVSSWVVDLIRNDNVQSVKQSTNIFAAHVHDAIILSECCGVNPSCSGISWFTETLFTGMLSVGDHNVLWSLPLDIQGHRWLVPNMHEGHMQSTNDFFQMFEGNTPILRECIICLFGRCFNLSWTWKKYSWSAIKDLGWAMLCKSGPLLYPVMSINPLLHHEIISK